MLDFNSIYTLSNESDVQKNVYIARDKSREYTRFTYTHENLNRLLLFTQTHKQGIENKRLIAVQFSFPKSSDIPSVEILFKELIVSLPIIFH
jgi:hypothetical protein